MDTIQKISHQLVLLWLQSRKQLVEDIASQLEALIHEPVLQELNTEKYFTDGAPNPQIVQTIRWKSVYIFSDPNGDKDGNWPESSINDIYMYTRALSKIAKDFGAQTVNVFYTTFPYARDDKYDDLWNSTSHKRKANLANLAVSDTIHDGNRYCVTLDLHNPATFNRSDWTRFVNLGTWRAFEEIVAKEWLSKKDAVLSWCDEWSLKKIRKTAQDLSMKHIITLKEKDYSQDQEVEDIIVLWDVAGKDVILYDDILDTGGTFCKTIEKIHEKGPNKIIWFVTHLLLNNDAQSKLDALYHAWKLQKLYTTNTVHKNNLPSYIEIIDVSTLFANTIMSIENNQSIDYNNG